MMLPNDFLPGDTATKQGLALSKTSCPFEELSSLWPWYFCRLWVASLYVFSLACCTWSVRKEEGDCGTFAKKGWFFPLKRQGYFFV